MKNNIPLVALTLLVLAFAGCSKHSSAAAPKNFDLGVIEVSGGKPNSQILPDGRGCTITPTVRPDGNINLDAMILETNASGVKQSSRSILVPGAPSDQAYTIIIDKDTLTVKLHK